jgi:hypothetical protein
VDVAVEERTWRSTSKSRVKNLNRRLLLPRPPESQDLCEDCVLPVLYVENVNLRLLIPRPSGSNYLFEDYDQPVL